MLAEGEVDLLVALTHDRNCASGPDLGRDLSRGLILCCILLVSPNCQLLHASQHLLARGLQSPQFLLCLSFLFALLQVEPGSSFTILITSS
jgi:hypothetical protein